MTPEQKAKALRLVDWAVMEEPYRAPELGIRHLRGFCPEHPYAGGNGARKVTTSRISEVDGRYVRTRSGSVYKLGPIEPKYRQYLRDIGRSYDRSRPLDPFDGLVGPEPPPARPGVACTPVEGLANVMDGWGCCRCHTYNMSPSVKCRYCEHARCDGEN